MSKVSRAFARRGVQVKQGGIVSWWNRKGGLGGVLRAEPAAEGLFDTSKMTIYTTRNPTKSAFAEEALHAIQSLTDVPRFGTVGPGRMFDNWERMAQSYLIKYRGRLGIPNDQKRQTIFNLGKVMSGEY